MRQQRAFAHLILREKEGHTRGSEEWRRNGSSENGQTTWIQEIRLACLSSLYGIK